ncbi:hypothetical protein MHLNE_25040 [Moorella humiferrea]|uniref:BMC domain-containing protein n=1 Tax=Neomoorella humiferrea TaxID=676965 RepID=UPI0030CA98F1
MNYSLGLVEFNSIAKGIEAADTMAKAAKVDIVTCRTICPGKYIVLISGEVAAVETAVQHGLETGGIYVVDEFVLPNVHPSVIGAITATSIVNELKALGIIEVFSVATAIVAADTAVKAADVQLIEVRLGIGTGGKSFITLTGDVAAVTASVEAAVTAVSQKGLLVEKVIIPSPHRDLRSWLL